MTFQKVIHQSSHWKYINNIEIKNTNKYLDNLIDMRIPLTFSDDDCNKLAKLITAHFVKI